MKGVLDSVLVYDDLGLRCMIKERLRAFRAGSSDGVGWCSLDRFHGDIVRFGLVRGPTNLRRYITTYGFISCFG